VKLGVYADRWIENYRGRTSRGFEETTRERYREEVERRIKPYFGGSWIAEIEPGDVKAWSGWLEARGVSPAGVRKAKRVLSALMADAREEDRLRGANPVAGVRYVSATPEPPKAKPRGLSPEEVARFLAHVPERYRLLFEFLGHTGVRIGEALGLRWHHVHLGDDPHVEIREQVYQGKRKARPKTHHSVRSLPLSPGMAQAIAAHKGESEWTGPGDPVFASLDGKPLDYSNVRRRALLPAKEASGIDWPKGKAFHLFRSTAATLFHHRGKASDRELADVLGHADPAFTKRVYVGSSDRPAEVGFLDELIPPTVPVINIDPDPAEVEEGGEKPLPASARTPGTRSGYAGR
jgi:integrase